jgi:GNAT superfamily N-acetyltransferase
VPTGEGFETVAFSAEDAASDFRSGVEPLDRFFRTQAGQNQRKNVSRTWVLRRTAEKSTLPDVLGFYTLTLGSVERETLPSAMAGKLPRYPVPVVLIGRLAVDERARRQRIGERLLLDAHDRALAIAAQGGAVGVIVDAKDGAAAAFYGHYGYEVVEVSTAANISGWPQRMFLPMQTLLAARDAVQP